MKEKNTYEIIDENNWKDGCRGFNILEAIDDYLERWNGKKTIDSIKSIILFAKGGGHDAMEEYEAKEIK